MKTIRLTTFWTAAEAATVHEFLGELRTAIWLTYKDEIIETYRDLKEPNAEDEPFNDDLPF